MREPLDGSLWWYWIAANAAKKNGASFKNYHRLSHLFYLCGVQIRRSLFVICEIGLKANKAQIIYNFARFVVHE